MDINFVFYECQNIDGNDKGFLIDRSIASKHDVEYISLSLTLIRYIKTSIDVHLES